MLLQDDDVIKNAQRYEAIRSAVRHIDLSRLDGSGAAFYCTSSDPEIFDGFIDTFLEDAPE